MSIDLVVRLRGVATHFERAARTTEEKNHAASIAEEIREAADEIERLRAAGDMLFASIKSNADEIERLRAALKQCADDLAEELETRYGGTQDLYTPMQRRYERDMQTVLNARAAFLGKMPPDEGTPDG